jgi:phosphoglycolate phosphatase-like HAD superfamily hydrolase
MTRPRTIMVDLDGVLCTEEQFHDRPLAEPIAGAREALEKLRAAGYIVVVYTARSWGEHRATKHWLDQHGFTYDGIQMGKPVADVWIDDRALRFTSWNETLRQLGL